MRATRAVGILQLALVALLLGAPLARAQTLEELGAVNDKSAAAVSAGDFAAAATYAQQALEIGEKVLEPSDPRLPVLAGNAGLLHEKTENWAAASAAWARAVELRGKLEGESSPALLEPLQKLMQAQSRNKQHADAYASGQRVQELIGERNGEESIEYGDLSASLAVLAVQDKHPKRADRHLRAALSVYRKHKGDESVEVARTYLGLAYVQFQLQQPSAGADYLKKASKVFDTLPDGHPEKLRALEQRVQLLKTLGQPEDAKLLADLERNRAAAATYKPDQPGVSSK